MSFHPHDEFLSPAWFRTARRLVADVRVSPETSARLQFDADGVRWHLVVDAGEIVGFDRGEIDCADAKIMWKPGDAWRILSRELRGDAALSRTTVMSKSPAGMYIGRAAPMDLGRMPELALLPRLPGATFSVEYALGNGPFGAVNYGIVFEDGRLVNDRLGRHDEPHAEPDVRLTLEYRKLARLRSGEISALEAVAGGGISGRIGALAAFDGIVESPAFHRAELATGRHMLALAALGELDADPMFVSATEELTFAKGTAA